MGYVEEMLAPGEPVRHRARRHWVVLARWVGGGLLVAALGAVMAGLFGFAGWSGAGGAAGIWAGVALAVAGLALAVPGWLRWSCEVYLVTDRRVVQVEGVLRKHTLDSGLAKVNDVRLTQSLPGRLLGYGSLEIITASDTGINRLDDLPRPVAFKQAMMAAAADLARRPAGTAPAAPVAGAPDRAPRSAADRMADLEELLRRGLLSDEEYRAKRAEILQGV